MICEMTQTHGNESQNSKEKKMRRLWKSFSEEPVSFTLPTSEEKADEKSGKRFGSVLPALRLQLAEQGDSGAQLELARELLVTASIARIGEGQEEEAEESEEMAVFWLLRAAEQGEDEAMDTLKVE